MNDSCTVNLQDTCVFGLDCVSIRTLMEPDVAVTGGVAVVLLLSCFARYFMTVPLTPEERGRGVNRTRWTAALPWLAFFVSFAFTVLVGEVRGHLAWHRRS